MAEKRIITPYVIVRYYALVMFIWSLIYYIQVDNEYNLIFGLVGIGMFVITPCLILALIIELIREWLKIRLAAVYFVTFLAIYPILVSAITFDRAVFFGITSLATENFSPDLVFSITNVLTGIIFVLMIRPNTQV